MGPWLAALRAVDAAEARGDAAAALRLVEENPRGPDGRAFWRPERVRYLRQLVDHGPVLPAWATSRWVLSQAVRWLDASSRGRGRAAEGIATDTRGGPDTLRGVDRWDARCRLADGDWIYRQAYLYELGGLSHFLRRIASGDLLSGADQLHEWTRAPMGGYRLVGHGEQALTWQCLDTGVEVCTPNLGAGALVGEGEHALGRLVPTAEGSFFETVPLGVPEATAVRVAEDPGAWVAALRDACWDGPGTPEAGPVQTYFGDFGLLTDLPELLWLRWCQPGVPRELVGRFLSGGLGAPAAEVLPCVAALLMEPGVLEELTTSVRPTDAEPLRVLAGRLGAPAATVCARVAEAAARAA